MAVLAGAAGHDQLDQFSVDDLTTLGAGMARLSGVAFGGVDLGQGQQHASMLIVAGPYLVLPG